MYTIYWVVAALSLAMFVRSAFGFAHGAVAMPLLLSLIPMQLAVPLLGAISLLASVIIIFLDRREFSFSSSVKLAIGAVVGIPFGIYVLTTVNPYILSLIVCFVLVIAGVRVLFGAKLPELRDDRLSYIFGFFAGILGGSANLPGIPVAIYGNMRRLNAREFNLLLSGFFLLTGTITVAGHSIAGLWTHEFWKMMSYAIIPSVISIFIGRKLVNIFNESTFSKVTWIIVVLVCIAVASGDISHLLAVSK